MPNNPKVNNKVKAHTRYYLRDGYKMINIIRLILYPFSVILFEYSCGIEIIYSWINRNHDLNHGWSLKLSNYLEKYLFPQKESNHAN